MNNQTQPKLLSFFKQRVSTRAGIAIIVTAFFICSVILIWQAQLLKEEMRAIEIVPEIIVKDETADWKTYRNEEYGFEIKYPSTWEVAVEQDLWEERGFLQITVEGPGKIEKRLVESMEQKEEIIESGAQLIISYEQGLSHECEGTPGLNAFCCPPECELVEISGKQGTKTLKKDVAFIQNNYQWQAEVDSRNPFPRRVFFLLRYNPENYLAAEENFSQTLSTFRFLE
ncbi:hypothetical protein AMJ49_03930 [Parcubacteria bacterium DG_74_2]|nr:MAG: hypothetical protein AMJ49_03930 [Parcubacteria bacterium DG_74_2]